MSERLRWVICICVYVFKLLERVKRIELSSSAWKAEVLPLNYTRIIYREKINGGPDRDRTGDLLRDRQTC